MYQHLRERAGRSSEGLAEVAEEATTGISDRRWCRGEPESAGPRAAVLMMQYLIEVPIKEAKTVPPKWVKISQYVPHLSVP